MNCYKINSAQTITRRKRVISVNQSEHCFDCLWTVIRYLWVMILFEGAKVTLWLGKKMDSLTPRIRGRKIKFLVNQFFVRDIVMKFGLNCKFWSPKNNFYKNLIYFLISKFYPWLHLIWYSFCHGWFFSTYLIQHVLDLCF